MISFKFIFFDKIPIKKPTAAEARLFERLVPLVQLAKGGADRNISVPFLEELMDACVLECYFREHMAERDLLLHDLVAKIMDGIPVKASSETLRVFVASCETAPIRARLARLATASPELLGVIQREGAV